MIRISSIIESNCLYFKFDSESAKLFMHMTVQFLSIILKKIMAYKK